MTAFNAAEYAHTLGSQAKAASALMAKTQTATKNIALGKLAELLRANVAPLQAENAKDIARAMAAGLANAASSATAAAAFAMNFIHPPEFVNSCDFREMLHLQQ